MSTGMTFTVYIRSFIKSTSNIPVEKLINITVIISNFLSLAISSLKIKKCNLFFYRGK